MSETERKQKLLGLEGLRFAAAFAVLLWHYQHFAYLGLHPLKMPAGSLVWHSWLGVVYKHGYLGVHVFWGISGFIFFWRYSQAIAHRQVSAWAFFVRRFSRLYPLHLLTLVLIAVLQGIYFSGYGMFFVDKHNDTRHFLLHVFMASNWGLEKGYSFNSSIWSVSVELLVYVMFFVLCLHVRRQAWVVLFMIALSLCLRRYIKWYPVIECALFFYLGALSALLYDRFPLRSGKRLISCIILLVLCAGLNWYTASFWDLRIRYRLFVPVVLYVLAHPWFSPGWVATLLTRTGALTYGMYLIHFPLQLMIVMAFGLAGAMPPVGDPALLIGYLAATVLVAIPIYDHFEAPMRDAIRRRLLTS